MQDGKEVYWAREMAQWEKQLALKPSDLSSAPMWQEERTSSYRLNSDLHWHAVAHMCMRTHKIDVIF